MVKTLSQRWAKHGQEVESKPLLLELGEGREMEGHEEAEFVCQMIYNLEAMGKSSGFFVFAFVFILVETLWEFAI